MTDIVERLRARGFRLAVRDFNSDGAMLAKEAADEIERLRSYLTRIIQVRGGAGMFEGKEALDEMARLAGEALASDNRTKDPHDD